jgi:hypothetical protein
MEAIKFTKQVSFGFLINVLLFYIIATFITIPWTFIYIEIGRYSGPYLGLVLTALVLTVMCACTSIVSYQMLRKMKESKTKWSIITNLAIILSLAFLLSLLFMHNVSEAHQKIDTFITQNKDLEFHQYVSVVCSFLDSNLKNAYKKPEAYFKIDENIYSPISLGKYIIQQWGFTRANIIIYQGWGTCGQAAILIEELLLKAGYETRQAHFKDIDHAWAEVKYNGTWLIIDPWYIGNFQEAQNLKNLRPEFQNATGVIVQYPDGTINDASQEHGY